MYQTNMTESDQHLERLFKHLRILGADPPLPPNGPNIIRLIICICICNIYIYVYNMYIYIIYIYIYMYTYMRESPLGSFGRWMYFFNHFNACPFRRISTTQYFNPGSREPAKAESQIMHLVE